ncbi:GNAT family N-acetyltransferase [Flavobacterium sp.]|uniref:GNAT family N-acetyltransferase n=1 Tax=Flavobacterium sp. TaxID=239 RepID=UPI00333FE0EB
MYKVLIRPLIISDAQISFKWRNDPKIWELTGSKPKQEITLEIEHDWIKKAIADKTTKRFAILVDDVYVGNIQLTDIIEYDTAQYHVFIGDRNYWGKGIAKLATNQILYYAKVVLGLKNIFLKVRKENFSAIKVYKKNGFKIVNEKEDWIKMNCDISQLETTTASVFVMVYNHEKYIAECLEGILMQKCNFNFDIVVGEDCSTDKSREILLEYQNRYPGKFKLLLHETNIGAANNQMEVFKNCKGKYIAMCEGDDYWIDPLKLQKQVDFLEANEDYVLIHSDIFLKNSSGENIKSARNTISKIIRWPKNNDYNVVKYLVKGNYIMTLTVLITKNALFKALNKITENDNEIATIDYTIFLELSKLGKIHYQQEKTAVYRILPNSASNNTDLDARLSYIESTINISRFYNQKFTVGICKLYFDRVQLSAQLYEFAKRGLVIKCISTFYRGIKSDKLNILRLKNYYYFIVLIVSKIK